MRGDEVPFEINGLSDGRLFFAKEDLRLIALEEILNDDAVSPGSAFVVELEESFMVEVEEALSSEGELDL